MAPSRETQLRYVWICAITEDAEATARVIRGSNLHQFYRLRYFGNRTYMHHGTAWFQMWVLGGF